jgi:hypothetical protein
VNDESGADALPMQRLRPVSLRPPSRLANLPGQTGSQSGQLLLKPASM